MLQPIISSRGDYQHWNDMMLTGAITIGFLGGSITDPRPGMNWPVFVRNWIIKRYPTIRFKFENAAIGATGSDLAALRVKRDIIDRKCDVVFIEYAVNDETVDEERRGRTKEGLVRQLKKAGIQHIIFIYTFSDNMRRSLEQGNTPSTIEQFEMLADRYNIPSLWVGLYGYEQVKNGRLTYEDWLPDGLHPSKEGSEIYAECIINYLDQHLILTEKYENQVSTNMLEGKKVFTRTNLPLPLYEQNWESITELPLNAIQTTGAWYESRWHNYEWIETMLETNQIGSRLSFEFEGRGLMLVFDYGKCSADFQYRIDYGEWIHCNRDCPDWVGDDGWLRLYDCGEAFNKGLHKFELEVLPPYKENETIGNLYFRLGKVGVIKHE